MSKKKGFLLRTIGADEKRLKRILQSFDLRSYSTIYGVDIFFKTESKRRRAKKLISKFVYSSGDPLEVVVGRLLGRKNLTVAVAESCTGGMLGSIITSVSGSSRYFLGGIIAYDNRIKEKVLGVMKVTLISHGAVSLESGLEMARGVRKRFGSDLGISITGIAGPTGGTKEKPVGLVYIGLAGIDFDIVDRFHFKGDRYQVRLKACYHALDLLRRFLIKELP